MKSGIDDELNERERALLRMYARPAGSEFRRQVRLSFQYAVGAGIFLGLALWKNQPRFAIVGYVIFLLWMLIRLRAARRAVGVMPGIIEKYERRIELLKSGGEAAKE